MTGEPVPHCWFMEAPDGSHSAGPFDTEAEGLRWREFSAEHYTDWKPIPLYREPRMSPQDFGKVATALAFFASAIKSGEDWTPECEAYSREAHAALLRIGGVK